MSARRGERGGPDDDDDRSSDGDDEDDHRNKIRRLLLAAASSSDSDGGGSAIDDDGAIVIADGAVASAASLPVAIATTTDDDDPPPPRSDDGRPTTTNDEGRPVSYSEVDPRRVYCGGPLPIPSPSSTSSFASVAAAVHPATASHPDLAAAIAATYEGLIGGGGGAATANGAGGGGGAPRCGPEVGPQCPSCARYQNMLRVGTLRGRFPSLVPTSSSSSSSEQRQQQEEEDETFVLALRSSGGSLALATTRLSKLHSIDPTPTERQVSYLTNRLLRKFSNRFALPRKVVEIALRKSKCDATGAVSYLFGDGNAAAGGSGSVRVARSGGGGGVGPTTTTAAAETGGGGGGTLVVMTANDGRAVAARRRIAARRRVLQINRGMTAATTTTTEARGTGGSGAAAATNDQAACAEECFQIAVEEAVNERLRSMGLGVGNGKALTEEGGAAAAGGGSDDRAAEAKNGGRGVDGASAPTVNPEDEEERKAPGRATTATAGGADVVHETKRSAHPFSPLLATLDDNDDGGPPPKVIVTKGHRMVLVEESTPASAGGARRRALSGGEGEGGGTEVRRKVERCALCCGKVPSVVSGRYKCSLCNLCEGCVQSDVDLEDRPREEGGAPLAAAAPGGGTESLPSAAPKEGATTASATARGAEDDGNLPRRRSVVLCCPALLNGGHLHQHPLTFTLERARRCVCDVEGPNCTIRTKSTKNECSWRCASGCDFDVCGSCVGMDPPSGFRRGDARGAASTRGGGAATATAGNADAVIAAARARTREMEALLNDLNPVEAGEWRGGGGGAGGGGGGGRPIALTVTVNGTNVTPTATGMRRVAAAAGRNAAALARGARPTDDISVNGATPTSATATGMRRVAAAASRTAVALSRENHARPPQDDPRSPRPPLPPPAAARSDRGPAVAAPSSGAEKKWPPTPPPLGWEEPPAATTAPSPGGEKKWPPTPPPPGWEEPPTATPAKRPATASSESAAAASSSSGGDERSGPPNPKRRKIASRMEEMRRRAAAAVAAAAAMRAGGAAAPASTSASAPSFGGGGAGGGRPGASGEEEGDGGGNEGPTSSSTTSTMTTMRAALEQAQRATQAAIRRLSGGGADGGARGSSDDVGRGGPSDVPAARSGAGGAGGGGRRGGGSPPDGGAGVAVINVDDASAVRDAARRMAQADVAMAWNGPPTSLGAAGAAGSAVAPIARGATLVGAGTVGGGGAAGGLPGDVAFPAAFLRAARGGGGQNGDVRAEYLMRRARRDYEMWRAQQNHQIHGAAAVAAARRGRAPATAPARGNGAGGKGKFMMLSRDTEEALRQMRERSCYAARSNSLGPDLETKKPSANAAASKRAAAAAANPREGHKENPKKPPPPAATATDLIYAESLLRSAQGVADGGGGQQQQQHAVLSFRKKVYAAVCAAVAAGRLGDAGTMLVSSRYGPAFLARGRDAADAPPAPHAAATAPSAAASAAAEATSAGESAKRKRDEAPPSAAAKGGDDDNNDEDDDESAKCWCGERLDPGTSPAGAVGCLRDHPMHPSCACDLLLGGSMSCPTCRDLLYLPGLSSEETEFAVDFVREEVRRLEREIRESNRPKEDSKAGATAATPLGAGDVVAISADADLCARVQGSDPLSGGWHPDMAAATGMEGRVLKIVEHDGRAVSARVKSISPLGHTLRAVGAKHRCVLGRLCRRHPAASRGGSPAARPDGPYLACAHCRRCEACAADPPGGCRPQKPCPGSVYEWSWDPRLLTLLRRSDQSTAEDEAKYDPKGMKAAMKAIERHVLQLRAELGAAKAGRDAVKAKLSAPFEAFKDRLAAAGGDVADGPPLSLSEESVKVLRDVVPKVSIPDALFAFHLLGLAEKWGDSRSARTKRDSVLSDVQALNLSSAARSIRRRNASRAVDDALWRDDLAEAAEYVVEPWANVDLLAAPTTGSSRTGFALGPGTRFQTSDERLLPSEEGGLSLWLRVGEDAKDSGSSEGSTPAPPSVGTRVRRGKGWTYGDQDGGEGNEGVVVSRRSDRVLVMWDGKRGAHHYRAAELEVSYSPPLPQGWIRVRPLGEESPAVVRRARKSIRCACCGDGLLPPPPQGEGGGSFSSVKGDAVMKGDRLVVAATLEPVVVESVRDGRIYCSFSAAEGNSECIDLHGEKPKENGGAIDIHGTAGKVLAAEVASVPCRDDNHRAGPLRKRTRLGLDPDREGGARVHGGCKVKEAPAAAAQDASCGKSDSNKPSKPDGKNDPNSKQSQHAGQEDKDVIWYRPEDLVLPRAAKTATQVIDHLDAKRLVEGRTVTRRELFIMTGRNENETRKRWIEASPSANQMELESDGGCGRQSQKADDDDMDIKCFATCLKGHLLHPRCLQRSMLSGRNCPVPGCTEPLWVPPVQETPNGDGDAADCCGSDRAGAIEAEALRSASDLSNDALALAEEEGSKTAPGQATPDERLPAASLSGQSRLKMCPSCCAGPFVNDHCDSMRTHHGQCTAMALRRGVVAANGAGTASTKACTPSGMFWASEADIVQSLAKLSGSKSVADVLPRCPTHDVVVMFNGCNTCGHLFTDTNWRDMPAWDPGAKAKLALDKKKMHAATLLATQVRKEAALLQFERNALSALALQEKAKEFFMNGNVG